MAEEEDGTTTNVTQLGLPQNTTLGEATELLTALIAEADAAVEAGRTMVASARKRKRALEASLKALSNG